MKLEMTVHPTKAAADGWAAFREDNGWTVDKLIGPRDEVTGDDHTVAPPTNFYYKGVAGLWVVVVSK